jgi:hypothetical protein
MADEIEIVDYDASWPRLFEKQRALLVRTLPADQIFGRPMHAPRTRTCCA